MMLEMTIKATVLLLDPLEQFAISPFSTRLDEEGYSWLYFSNFSVYAIVVCVVILYSLLLNWRYPGHARNKPNWVLFRNQTFMFIANLIKENLNVKVVVFFPVIYLTFLMILLANLIGMIPYSLTLTSSAAVTFFFSITFFIGITLVGYVAHKDALFQILLPAGVPLIIAPLLILVEATSYVARVFSLAIRLFANMMSGHGLLKILGSFVWAIILHGAGPFYFYFFPLAIVTIVILLELAIAFLQAYVFIVLISVYLNDVVCIH